MPGKKSCTEDHSWHRTGHIGLLEVKMFLLAPQLFSANVNLEYFLHVMVEKVRFMKRIPHLPKAWLELSFKQAL